MAKIRHKVLPRTLCLVFNKDKLLLIKFSEDEGKKGMSGVYNPPGGHIEKGEGIIECANREILEETGIKVDNTELKGIIHADNFLGKNILLFVTKSETNQNKIIETHEGKTEWIPVNKIDKFKIFEDLELIIKKVLSMNKTDFFTAKSRFEGDKLTSFTFE